MRPLPFCIWLLPIGVDVGANPAADFFPLGKFKKRGAFAGFYIIVASHVSSKNATARAG
jgi:hypothetical protein